jgi:hypothetical protein
MDEKKAEPRFKFGENWSKLIPKIDASRLEHAMADVRNFMDRDSSKGLSFLDIG